MIVGRDRRRATTLHRARLEPDDAGAIARTIRLPIADWTRYVCVQAAFREPREHDPGSIRCPFRRGQRLLGRLELRVPWTTSSSSSESYHSGTG